MFFFPFFSLYFCPSTPPLSLLPIGRFSFLSLPSTPHSPESPGAFILAGCFLYENTPIGRQASLSDTIHCTCIDMKSVLTSTTEFCGAAETAYQWQCRSCDQIKEAEKFWRQFCWCPCQTLKFHCRSLKVAGKVCFADIRGEFGLRKAAVTLTEPDTGSYFLNLIFL